MRLRFSAPCSCFLSTQGDTEKLAIFGRKRGRRGAELKVMAAVETKVPGYFTDKMHIGEADDHPDGFGTRTLVLKVSVLLNASCILLWQTFVSRFCPDAFHPLARGALVRTRQKGNDP